jgi:competence protein ComEC
MLVAFGLTYLSKKHDLLYGLMLAISCMLLGFYSGAFATYSTNTVMLTKELNGIWLEGDIDEISLKEQNPKVILKHLSARVDLSGISRVRISLKGDGSNLKIGDLVLLKATLMMPAGPVFPSGFDYRFYAYFKNIGAIGYALGRVKIIKTNQEHTLDSYV